MKPNPVAVDDGKAAMVLGVNGVGRYVRWNRASGVKAQKARQYYTL